MNPVVKAQLKAFREAHKNSELKENELFEVYSIHALSNGILTESIDPFRAHLEGTEFGIDGVGILVNGELCTNPDEVASCLIGNRIHQVEFQMFQAKTSEGVDYGDVSKFLDAVYSFFTSGLIDPTIQILDLQSAKDVVYNSALKTNPVIKCFFATTGTGEAGKHIQTLITSNRERLEELNIFEDVEIHVVGARQLQAGYRSATNSITESIEIPKSITLPPHDSVEEAYLGYISANELVKLATSPSGVANERRINRAVFFDNIRDFNPSSEINKLILEEIRTGSHDSFIFKNNGVTVVAKEIHRTGDNFRLDDYQIVNGCQTSNILFLAGEDANEINVPFRLIGSKDPEFVSSIIIGTNRQNEVKEDQFWALTPFMKDLEEYCREQHQDLRLHIERRENQYREEGVERTRIVKPSELVKAVAAMFLFQPHRSARDYRGIRSEFSGKLFQVEHSVEPYHVAAIAGYKFDFLVRNKRIDRACGIYKYFVLFAIGRLVTAGKDIFSIKKSLRNKWCANMLKLVANNDDFSAQIAIVSAALDEIVTRAGLIAREQIRDYIRNESVTKLLEQRCAKGDLSIVEGYNE